MSPSLSEKAQYDVALVKRALEDKDQKAYAELMDRYQGAIFHLVNRMVYEDDAEDLTIETFTKAFKRLHQYTPAFSTWLFKIASNHTIDFIRKKRINASRWTVDSATRKVSAWASKTTDWTPWKPCKSKNG